jgi:3-polyprenyl-4-hydroxybenzoate decarboxylase
MVSATEMGAIVMPPMPAFYALPKTLDDLVQHTVGRILDLFGVDKFTLDILEKDAQADGKTVGTCDGGTKKIVYKRG